MKHFIIGAFLLISQVSFANEKKEILKVMKAFGKELKAELRKGLKKSEIEALKVCHSMAPKIAKKYSNQKIKVGRVSSKPRNQDNYIENWMSQTIELYKQKKLTAAYTKVDLPSGGVGILKPIYINDVCLKCHGSNISSQTQKLIESHYPKDKATGYKIGDLRGFIWGTKSK